MKRSTIGERLGGRPIESLTRLGALSATAVDEALADDATLGESTPTFTQRGSRRELTGLPMEAERRIVDHPHVGGATAPAGAADDGALLRRLSQQLSSLQAQQDQIRRLLEQAEQHATKHTVR